MKRETIRIGQLEIKFLLEAPTRTVP